MLPKITYSPLLLVWLAFSACEKRELPPSSTTAGPSLFVQGKANTVPFYYGGGQDMVQLNTTYEDYQFADDTIRTWVTTFLQAGKARLEFSIHHTYSPEISLLESLKNAIEMRSYAYLEFPNTPTAISTVALTLIDEFGMVHNSSFIHQTSATYFEINGVEEITFYGYTYVQVHVLFHCHLANPVDPTIITLSEGKGILVFGGI
jgi:hypothetical protein